MHLSCIFHVPAQIPLSCWRMGVMLVGQTLLPKLALGPATCRDCRLPKCL